MEFAELLLNETTMNVIKLRMKNENNSNFVFRVLSNWLSRDDDDPDEPAVPRTWEDLAQCMEDARLDGALVKTVRDTFC